MKKINEKNKKSDSFVKLMSGITFVFIMLLLTIFLFYTGNNGFTDIQNAKYKAFLLLCGGYVLICLICLIEGALLGTMKISSAKNIYKKLSPLQKFVILYMIFTWVSAFLSDYFPKTIIGATRYEGALTITIYCIIFLFVSIYGKADKKLLWIISAVLFVFCVICVIQLMDINIFNLYPDGYKYSDAYIAYPGAYLGTIGNVDLVAAFFCMIIPIIAISVIKIKGIKKLLLIFPLAVALYVLIKMNVLAGIVGIITGMLISTPVVFIKTKKNRIIYTTTVISTGIFSLMFIYAFDLPFELMHQLHEIMHGNISDTFGSGRIHIWKSVISDLQNHFLFGSGPDTMVYANLEPFKRYDQTLNSMIVSGIDIAHNEYLNILSQQGVFSFVAYMAIVIYAVFKWITSSYKNTVAKITGSAMLCYFIQAIFGFSMCMTAPFFWVTLGLFDKSLKGEEIICGRK